MLYTRENIGTIKKENTESAEIEANKKIDKILKKYNKILNVIPEWIKNIENEKFRFKGKDFECINEKIQIKKNILFDINSFNEEQKKEALYSDFSINFNNLFTYSLNEKNNVRIMIPMKHIEFLSENGVSQISTKPIEDFFSNMKNFEEFNKKILYLYQLKNRKEKTLRGLTSEKKEIANSIFENYFFTTNEKENDHKLQEIEGLLLLTIDLKSKNKVSRKENAKLL